MSDKKVPALELDRLLQNLLLFADEKAMALNEILLLVKDDRLFGFACDDYVVISDSIVYPWGIGPAPRAFLIEDIEKVAEWVKRDKKVVHKYDILIQPKMTGVIFECDETSTEDVTDNIFIRDAVPSENWKVVHKVLNEDLPLMMIQEFAVRPERLSKLWRLKADKEAPIDLRGVELDNQLLLQFKKGDTLKGSIMPVQRQNVREEFLWSRIDR